MPPQDWNQIKQVFSAALNVPPGEREAYLASACEGRGDVREAVEELLRAHYDASQTFLEPSSIVLAASWLFREGDRVAGRFKVIKRIARGAMGEVYQVYDERLRLHVALKAIRPELIGDADTVERFRREVLVTRDIAHDGLCRVFDLVEHAIGPQAGFPDGTIVPCLTMQLLEGESLEEWLARSRPMTPAAALPLLTQIGEALQVLHDAGVVHRDLKPSNVMLVQTGEGTRAVLTDFGLAKPLDESVFETQARVQGGAPFFMAPELFRGERPSRASDIYAFGLLIDEMVTTERAFSGDSLHALLLEKLGDGPRRPSVRAPGLPLSWEEAILGCLAPDPSARPSTPRSVLGILARERRRAWRWPARMSPASPLLRRRRRAVTYSAAAALALTGVVALTAPAASEPGTSVAILPFANLTGEAENDYLAVGTAGELGRRLSRVSGWRVFAVRDQASATDLSARATFALRGHIQQSGQTLRITAELTDTREGTLVWSQNFEGPRERALTLEDDLASEAMNVVAREADRRAQQGTLRRAGWWLQGYFGRSRGAELPAQGTSKPDAFDAYLRGRYLYEDRTLGSVLAAVDSFKRAISLDPHFAAPYAGLADVQSALMDLHHAPHGQLLSDAERYAMEAVAIDPNLPEAQLSLAAVRQMQSRWSEAEAAYRRALQLHPTFARGHRWFGGMLLQFGRFDESLPEYERALELDPYDVPSQSAYGLALFYARRPQDAAVHLERLLSSTDHIHARFVLGQVYAYLGGLDRSRREYFDRALHQAGLLRQKSTAATSRYADLVAALAWSYHGDLAAAAPFVDALSVPEGPERVSPSFAARAYAAQGRVPEALAALEAAESERDRELMYLGVSPLYDGVRADPRFRALLARMHLSTRTGGQ
jgi:TolB-like protein/tetratricopeptide (TPR) repeat protein